MDPSTPAQVSPASGPDPARGVGAASTTGQRAALAERLRRHVAALEGVRHPSAAPERHRAARDYVASELSTLGLSVDLARSEEHTSELQSQSNLVCRLLLEKKKDTPTN